MKHKAAATYVIKKKNFGYWFFNDRGYTKDLTQAKRFTEAEAKEIVDRPNSDKTMHLFQDELFKAKPTNY